MKKQKRLANPGNQHSPAGAQDAILPVAVFKNSLRRWRDQWQAQKADQPPGQTEQQADPKAEQ